MDVVVADPIGPPVFESESPADVATDDVLDRPIHLLTLQALDAALKQARPDQRQALHARRVVVGELSLERPGWEKKKQTLLTTFARPRTPNGLRDLIREAQWFCRTSSRLHAPLRYLQTLIEDALAMRDLPDAHEAVDDLVRHLRLEREAVDTLRHSWTELEQRHQAAHTLRHWILKRDALFGSKTQPAETFRKWGQLLLGASLDLLDLTLVSGTLRDQGFVTEALDATNVHADHFHNQGRY